MNRISRRLSFCHVGNCLLARSTLTLQHACRRFVQLVAASYNIGGMTASAVILLEAAIREFEETLGLRHPGIVALSRRAEQLFETLPPDARAKVPAARPNQ